MTILMQGAWDMIDRQPSESKLLSWLAVVSFSVIIFITVPIARHITSYVKSEWGRGTFTYVAIGVMALVSIRVLAFLIKRNKTSAFGYLCLGVTVGIFVYQAYSVKAGSPEEAIHYIEYGALGLLIYRALSHSISDYSIYIVAILIGTLVGILDEIIQWFTPGRFFDLRDVWLNLTAVLLVQLALAGSVRPTVISGWPGAKSWQRVCYLSAFVLAVLSLCQLNTPQVIAYYTTRIPALAFINDFDDVMAEYGYLYDDPETGRFRSRLSPEALKASDKKRAKDVAQILNQYQTRTEYREFLKQYTAVKDPFTHEVRVHLFSRDANLERAQKLADPKRYLIHYDAAARENRILEKYFGNTLGASNYKWPKPIRDNVYKLSPSSADMESIVSRNLITRFSYDQVFLMYAALILILVAAGFTFGKRNRNQLRNAAHL